jgi:hypothetical protein
MDMKVKFSIRGANYSVALFISPEDRQKDVEWITKVLSPQPPAWIRVVEPGGRRWGKIVVMPRSDRLHID